MEFKVTSDSEWEKKLFSALCKKNGFHPYRYARQKYTTTMVRVSRPVMEGILWPQYEKYTELLREMVDAIASDLIDKIYKGDQEESIVPGEITSSN